MLENLRANMLRPDGMATLGSILAEENRHPLLLERFRQRLVEPRRERTRQALLAGAAQGQLPAGWTWTSPSACWSAPATRAT